VSEENFNQKMYLISSFDGYREYHKNQDQWNGLEYIRKHPDPDLASYDLITVYQILKRRSPCAKFHPGFAKRSVIDTLDRRYKYDDYVTTLVYLRCNAAIMGIVLQHAYPKKYDDPNDDIMEDETRNLYKAVRQYLINLDETEYLHGGSKRTLVIICC